MPSSNEGSALDNKVVKEDDVEDVVEDVGQDVEVDEENLFPDDCGLPGKDATFGNWVKRKVLKATFGFVNLGVIEEDLDKPPPFISYKLAKSRRNEMSVRRKLEFNLHKQELKMVKVGKPLEWVDVLDADGNPIIKHRAGEFIPFEFSEPIPFFHFPGQAILCPNEFKNQQSPIDECGMGVVGYFKLVKSLAVIFGIMSVIILPNLIMFSQSNSIPPRELYYDGLINSQTVLATSTIANLAEPLPGCRETHETQPFKFKCPAGFKIRSVVAYYGQPRGSCGCPNLQQVNFASACQGTAGKRNGTDVCLPSLTGPYAGVPLPCFMAINRFGNRCCSTTHMPFTNVGDLADLNLGPDTKCNSLTAPYIANALCEGKASCEFTIGFNQTYNIPTAKIPLYGAAAKSLSNICTNTNYNVTGMCTTTLGTNGAFKNCEPAKYEIASTQHTAEQKYKFVFEAVCNIETVTIGGGRASTVLDDEYVVYVATTLNAISIVAFILGVSWIQLKLTRQDEKSNANTCTAGDYSLILHTLPKDCKTVEDVKEKLTSFFTRVLHDDDYDVPVEIADINVTTGADNYLNALKTRGQAANTVDAVVGAIQSRHRRNAWFKKTKKAISNPSSDKPGEGDASEDAPKEEVRELKKSSLPLIAALKSALLHFEIANDNVQSLTSVAKKSLSKAFVTFNHEIHARRALHRYPSIGLLTYITQKPEDMLDGQTVFLERAPEPEEVIFENVPVPDWNRFLRFIFGTWMTLLLLAVSYAMIYEAKNLSTLFSGSRNKINCEVFDVDTRKNSNSTNQPSTTITYSDVLFDYDPAAYGVNQTTSSWGSYNYLQCYCSQVAFDSHERGDKDPMSVMKAYTFYDKRSDSMQTYCNTMLSGSVISMAANYIATFVIVIVNLNLSYLMKVMVDFEKHANETGRIMSMMIKLFIAQYINTAFLTLIIAGDISLAGGTNIRFNSGSYITFGIFTGTNQDYDTTWYQSVGSSILFTMFMFTIGNQPTVLLSIFQNWFTRTMDRKWSFKPEVTHVDTQKALDALYVGPELEMNLKYAAICTLVFVDMTYSATMPLFNIVTFINLVVIYASDKYMIFHLFKKPPVLNAALPKVVLNMLYIAAAIHVLNGMWMFGNNSFFNADIVTYFNTYTLDKVEFLAPSHEWKFPIKALDRLYGPNSRFLFAIACFLGLIFAIKIILYIFFDIFAGNVFLEYIKVVKPKSVEDTLEYNPTYFEAISVESAKVRVADADLSVDMEGKYKELLRKHNEAIEVCNAENIPAHINKLKLAHLRVQEAAMQEVLKNVVDPADSQAALHEHLNGDEEKGLAIADATDDAAGADKEDAEEGDKPKTGCAPNGCCYGTSCAPGESCDPLTCTQGPKEEAVEYNYSLGRNSENELITYKFKTIVGHESYNMNCVPRYTAAFGFNSDHLDRYFNNDEGCFWEGHEPREKDWVIEQKSFKTPDDDDEFILGVLHSCMPKRVRKMVKEAVLDEDGKKTGEVREVEKWVIPWQSSLLESYFGLCGGVECANGKKGLECLAQPNDDGEQPAWQNPFGSSSKVAKEEAGAAPSAPSASSATETDDVSGEGEKSTAIADVKKESKKAEKKADDVEKADAKKDAKADAKQDDKKADAKKDDKKADAKSDAKNAEKKAASKDVELVAKDVESTML